MDLNIPVMSINAGYAESRDLGLLHHIGMFEYDAGYQAGLKLTSFAALDKAYCLNGSPGLVVIIARCDVFGEAMKDQGIEYGGMVNVPFNDTTQYISVVEEIVGESGDWDGYGFLTKGRSESM